ncbi:hypothetical protein QOZ80_4BG0359010 [Eleusine coracana subsp. coracana]|nr:hypothetical protein QOZ80_4BG0359010 [Eleusine coracana subsp. coracana]
MEDHGGDHHHPPAVATLAYAWDHYQPDEHAGDDQQQQLVDCFAFSSSPSELRRALVRSLAELDAARAAHQAELRRVESEAARLAALVASAAAERDELRRHCHSLLLLLQHHHQPQEAPPPPLIRAGDDVQARGIIMDDDSTETELETALARRLPEKGRLVEAVVSAGPLLQTLLLAGPLPRWRHPPPPAPADIPPFNPGRLSRSPIKTDSFSSASAGSSSPESNCSGGAPPPLPQQQPLPPFHMSPFCM